MDLDQEQFGNVWDQIKNDSTRKTTKKSKKAEDLVKKVNELIDDVEKEENPVKITLMAIKVRMLIAKIDREKKLQNLKEKYEGKRDELKSEYDMHKDDSRLAELADQIQSNEEILNFNKLYDPENEGAIYSKKQLERMGREEIAKNPPREQDGNYKEPTLDDIIEAGANSLVNSEDENVRNASKRILATLKARKKIKDARAEISEIQSKQEQDATAKDQENFKLNLEEKSLTVVHKANIFARIGSFFSGVAKTVKDNFTMRREQKRYDKQYNDELMRVNMVYDQRVESLVSEMKAIEMSGAQTLEEVKQIKERYENGEYSEELQQGLNELIKERHNAVDQISSKKVDRGAKTAKSLRDQFAESIKVEQSPEQEQDGDTQEQSNNPIYDAQVANMMQGNHSTDSEGR